MSQHQWTPCVRRWLRRAVLVALLLVVAGWLALPLVPLPKGLFATATPAVELLDANGATLREISASDQLIGASVALSAVPEALVQATLAAEDQRFWSHSGVDWRATLRAAWGLVKNGRIVSGGSTITQQLVKLTEPRPRTFRTKFIEAAQALRLEQIWSKEQILTAYLNRLDYGNLRVGSAASAHFYFGKSLQDLSVAECALLAGLPQAPSRHNPHRNFVSAKKRQEWILGRMTLAGFLTHGESERAVKESLNFAPARRVFQAPHFVDLLLQQEPNALATSVVRTTLDLSLNRIAERLLQQQLASLHDQHARNGAVVVIENRTGNVLALVGSENYFALRDGQVNGAWAPRSAGSTFKPFTYLLALERGATPATMVADVPTEFTTPTGIFAPANYNHRCYGPMRYRLALANSLNISAVKVLASIGGAAVLQERLQACGLTTLKQSAAHYGLGLTIGNAETRLLELANAYACLARLGEFKPFRLTANSSAKAELAKPIGDADAAWLIADILSDNSARALAFGAESLLRFDFPVACKTGTSSDFRDNWALGFTPEFTVGVWIGNFDGTPMERVSGVTGAAPVLHELFEHLHTRFGTTWYDRPTNVVEKFVHPLTGKLASATTREVVREKFLARFLPMDESEADVDTRGRVRLSAEYQDWLNSADNYLNGRVVIQKSSTNTGLMVLSPLPGTVFFLDPDLLNNGERVSLRASGGGKLAWQSETLECRSEADRAFVLLREGRHELTVRDSVTGQTRSTWILVKSL